MIIPEATVCAILKRNGKVLITKRNVNPYKGKWCLPGGHINPFENAISAVKREVREETGLVFKPKFITYVDSFFKSLNIHHIALFFKGNPKGKLKNSQEVTEYCWITKKEIKHFSFAFHHKKILEDFWE